jgi:hypothetical protein
MLLKFLDALMSMDQPSVAATVAAHQAASAASAAVRATGSTIGVTDAEHFVNPQTPFWMWAHTLTLPSSPRPSLPTGSTTAAASTTEKSSLSSDSKQQETKTATPTASSSGSGESKDDDGASSTASGRKRRRAAAAVAAAALNRSSSSPASRGSGGKRGKKSKVTFDKEEKEPKESSTSSSSSSTSSTSITSSSSSVALSTATTELERLTIRLMRTCLSLSGEYGGRRTLRHMLELLRLLIGGTNQSHRQRASKLPLPSAPNLVSSGMLAVGDIVDKLMDRLLFDVDERAPLLDRTIELQLRGLSQQGAPKKSRTGSSGTATSSTGSTSTGATADGNDAATAATTTSLRYFLALLLHPPVPSHVTAPSTTTAIPTLTLPSLSPPTTTPKPTTPSTTTAASTIQTTTAAASTSSTSLSSKDEDALARLRIHFMEIMINRLATVFSRGRTNGYIAGYMTVLLPIVVHTRNFKSFVGAVMKALKRADTDLPMNSLACLLDALNQLFGLLRATAADASSSKLLTSRRSPALTAAPSPSTASSSLSPLVKSEPSENYDGFEREIKSDNGLCTWLITGNDFATQASYCCYTCQLTGNKGCCTACIRLCHAGHDIAYVGRNSMYCDCGSAQPSTTCQALVKPSSATTTATTSAATEAHDFTTSETVTSLVTNGDTKAKETKIRESKGEASPPKDDSTTGVTGMQEGSDEVASSTTTTTSSVSSMAALENHDVLKTIIHVIETLTKRIQASLIEPAVASTSPPFKPPVNQSLNLDRPSGSNHDDVITWLPSHITTPRIMAITSMPPSTFNFSAPPPPPSGRHGRGAAAAALAVTLTPCSCSCFALDPLSDPLFR